MVKLPTKNQHTRVNTICLSLLLLLPMLFVPWLHSNYLGACYALILAGIVTGISVLVFKSGELRLYLLDIPFLVFTLLVLLHGVFNHTMHTPEVLCWFASIPVFLVFRVLQTEHTALMSYSWLAVLVVQILVVSLQAFLPPHTGTLPTGLFNHSGALAIFMALVLLILTKNVYNFRGG